MSILLTSTCGLNLPAPSTLGHDISLGYHFTLASVDVGDLEIEWTVNRSDGQEEEEHLICYIEGVINHFTGFEGRVHFSSPDPQDGDASLTINSVKIKDKGTYQCTVKKFGEVQSRQIKLMVMEEVSVPESDVDTPVTVAAPITFSIIILAGIIFHCCKQKRQQKSDEENVSTDEESLVHTQSEMTVVMKEFDVLVITVPVL
uniref:Ig-like domain-containing protein n=1 Tax=Lates calcarifer TaxID=8187 RepID=A0A4W6G3N6_LATCA